MANDITLPGTGGVVATEEIAAGIHAQVVRGPVRLSQVLSEHVAATSGAATNLTTFNATSLQRNSITTVIVVNDTTVNDFVQLRDGQGGAILATLPAPAKGGAIVQFPLPLRTSLNTALAYDMGTGGSTIYLTFIGFKEYFG
jgi:hypothetical protein